MSLVRSSEVGLVPPSDFSVHRIESVCDIVVLVVAGELADFAPVGQSFCQGWQLRVKNALSLGWIVTT